MKSSVYHFEVECTPTKCDTIDDINKYKFYPGFICTDTPVMDQNNEISLFELKSIRLSLLNPNEGSYECSCPAGFEKVCYAYLE